MLQRSLVSLLIALLVFWGYKQCQTDDVHKEEAHEDKVEYIEIDPDEELPTPQPTIKPSPQPTRDQVKQAESMQIAAPKQQDPNKMPPYKKGVVRWKNVNGWAVSHGDLLQGKINDEAKAVKFGYHEPKPNRLWNSNIIPFTIQKEILDPKPILDAIKEMNARTVIKLEPWRGEEDVLVFAKADDLCLSYLGKVLPQQPILISARCKKDDVIHEVMHALGFVHEQSRIDRDQFVEIITDNIQPDFINQFDMVPDELVHDYRGSVFYFDYQSIMLYADTAFAKEPGLKTMQSKTPTPMPTSKNGLSNIDIERLYYLYGK